jgi:hypothetical protein
LAARVAVAAAFLAAALVSSSAAHTSTAGSCAFRLVAGPPWSEATGQHTLTLVLRNTATASCHVNGYPRVTLRTAGGRKLGFVYRDGGDQMLTHNPPHWVAVDERGSVFFAINKYRCDVRATAVARLAQVELPGSPSVISVRLPHYPVLDYCPAQAAGIGVDVSPIEPSLRALSAHQ